MGLWTRVGAITEPCASIPRIPQYPNPPGAPTFYPERAENDLILGLLVSPGYFFITLVLLVGLALGDASEYGVSPKHYCALFTASFLQMCLFNTFGFLLHLSAGAVEVVAAREAEANGATVSFTKASNLHILNLELTIFKQSKKSAPLFRVRRHPLPLVPCVS